MYFIHYYKNIYDLKFIEKVYDNELVVGNFKILMKKIHFFQISRFLDLNFKNFEKFFI